MQNGNYRYNLASTYSRILKANLSNCKFIRCSSLWQNSNLSTWRLGTHLFVKVPRPVDEVWFKV